MEKLFNILPSILSSNIKDNLKQNENEIWILILFPSRDITEAVINLTEAGAIKLKGISTKFI